MKSHHLFLGILCCLILFACNQDNDCDGTFVIEKILPNSNPPGSEVSIQGTGFSAKSTVRFAGQIAKSSFSNEKGLVAVVPNNVTGFVDLTVEEGDCLARADFEVLGTLPVNWVASPTVIIIPTLPSTFPSNLNNVWVNYYDPNYTLGIFHDDDCFFSFTGILDLNEFSTETHTTNDFLNNNPITGIYKCVDGSLEIRIDRTKKGGTIETYDGVIILPETVGESNNTNSLYMLLTSRSTGRQLIIRQQ
ncbi:MAG: IPT/TIG domain-containing protein [Saprospiraceae bacterium]|nr:IPT/TIG domain-containing protein [Saprospiraceae bacterium]